MSECVGQLVESEFIYLALVNVLPAGQMALARIVKLGQGEIFRAHRTFLERLFRPFSLGFQPPRALLDRATRTRSEKQRDLDA